MIWAFVGTFYLIWLSVQDFRKKMLVDDRKNYLMMGLSIGLIALFPQPLWYLLALAGVTFVLQYLLKNFKALGTADVHTLIWIIYGMGIVNMWALAYFGGILILFTLFYEIVKRRVFKAGHRWPFMFVILLDFVGVCLMFDFFQMQGCPVWN